MTASDVEFAVKLIHCDAGELVTKSVLPPLPHEWEQMEEIRNTAGEEYARVSRFFFGTTKQNKNNLQFRLVSINIV